MKKAIYSLAFLSLIVASPALAAEGTLRARIASTTDRIKEVKTEIKDRIEVRKASSTDRRVVLQASIIKRLVEHTGKMMQATIDRLEKIITRIESRIAKVKAEGAITTDSESWLLDAKVHINAAKTDLASFLAINLSGDNLSENMMTLRDAAAQVKTELRAAQSSLVKAVTSLKPGRTASTTPVTSQ